MTDNTEALPPLPEPVGYADPASIRMMHAGHQERAALVRKEDAVLTSDDYQQADVPMFTAEQVREAQRAALAQLTHAELVAWMYHDGPTREAIPSDVAGTVVLSLTRQPHYSNETPLYAALAQRQQVPEHCPACGYELTAAPQAAEPQRAERLRALTATFPDKIFTGFSDLMDDARRRGSIQDVAKVKSLRDLFSEVVREFVHGWPAHEQPSLDREKAAFIAWAAEDGRDSAHAFDNDRSRWVFWNPMTADLWSAWLARAALAQRQQVPTTAWLVEWRFNGVQWLYLWPSAPGGFSFTSDASKALRFARREDAEAALQWARNTDAARRPIGSLTRHGLALGEMLVTEHDWPALTAAPSAQVEPSDDWQHLKQYGYAPGGYMSKCHRCGATPIMDKLAVTCRPCAETMHNEAKGL